MGAAALLLAFTARAQVEIPPDIAPWGFWWVDCQCCSNGTIWRGINGCSSSTSGCQPHASEQALVDYLTSTIPNDCGVSYLGISWPTLESPKISYYCGNYNMTFTENVPQYWPQGYTTAPTQEIENFNYAFAKFRRCTTVNGNPTWSDFTRHVSKTRKVACPTNYTVKKNSSNQLIGPCISGSCTSDANCSDGRYCDGHETCVSGKCQAGPQPCEPDGLACTKDVCDETAGCSYPPVTCDDGLACTSEECVEDAGGCVVVSQDVSECTTCNDGPPPEPEATSDELNFGLAGIDCLFTDGNIGAGLQLKADGSYTPAACSNDCVTSFSSSAELTVSFEHCGPAKSGTASATFGQTRKQCLECDATCGQTCTAGACVDSSANGQVGLGISTSKGFGFTASAGPLFHIDMRCNGELGASGTLGATVSKKEDQGSCDTCDECTSLDIENNVQASATAACSMHISSPIAEYSATYGCTQCLRAELNGKLATGGQAGECGGTLCSKAAVSGRIAAEMPTVDFTYGWMRRSVRCNAFASACAEQNTCGECTSCQGCSNREADASCVTFESTGP